MEDMCIYYKIASNGISSLRNHSTVLYVLSQGLATGKLAISLSRVVGCSFSNLLLHPDHFGLKLRDEGRGITLSFPRKRWCGINHY